MRHTFAILLLLVAGLRSQIGLAATVTSTADSGPGSLRAAIAAAAPGETVIFSVTGAITLTSGELLVNKDLIISGPGLANLTIQRSTTAGTPEFRIFNIDSGIVTISGLALQNGSASASSGGGLLNQTTLTLRDSAIIGNSASIVGGGIMNLSTLIMSNCVIQSNSVLGITNADASGGGIHNSGGTLTLLSCTVSSNSVSAHAGTNAFGGGIYNDGTASLSNSIIAGNSVAGPAQAAGGGIFNNGTLAISTTTIASNVANAIALGGSAQGGGVANGLGTVTLNRSTVSGNLARGSASAQGGAIANDLGTVIVESSTLSGNVASVSTGGLAQGGALFNGLGSIMLSHSTITANTPGGLFNFAGVAEIKNVILGGNSGGVDLFNGPSGDTHSGGFNLFGILNVAIVTGPGDQLNFTASALKLGPLQNNGGPTFTHALLCGSPAINAGDNAAAPPTDQRGFPRIVNGVIDVGSYEASSNTPPTVTCPAAATVCSSSNAALTAISVTVADADGDQLTVVWTVDGVSIQTNQVVAGATPTRVDLTALFAAGPHQITVTVFDASGCTASCSTSLTAVARGDLYPIALSQRSLAGLAVGAVISDIYNGVQPGNFGWLTWAGSASEPTLLRSLTPPGNSSTYINPNRRKDHEVSVGDWVQGKPGVSNSDEVRRSLDRLKAIDITVPVWDQATGRGNNSLYRVVAFARVRILSYHLPNQNRITARFLGLLPCD